MEQRDARLGLRLAKSSLVCRGRGRSRKVRDSRRRDRHLPASDDDHDGRGGVDDKTLNDCRVADVRTESAPALYVTQTARTNVILVILHDVIRDTKLDVRCTELTES